MISFVFGFAIAAVIGWIESHLYQKYLAQVASSHHSLKILNEWYSITRRYDND